MLFSPSSVFVSFLCVSRSLVFALPSESPAEALVKLQARAQCNANDCLRALQNRPSLATPFCESYILQTPGTVTVTKYVSATSTQPAPTTTLYIGTTTTTVGELAAATSTLTQFVKRIATTTPLSAILTSVCTPSPSAPVTYRISSACSCLLSSSATATSTITVTTTLPVPPMVTQTTSYASTAVTSAYTATTTVGITQQVPASCSALYTPGQPFVDTSSGKSYTLSCGYYLYETVALTDKFNLSFRACIEACSAYPNCNGVNYVDSSQICILLQSEYFISGSPGFAEAGNDAAWISS